ncbi:MAG: N-acetylmuramoyl-L-alanine amidase [Evtepia sp.]|uniref:N-acetylmuramoyl-L-alanine amidase n=1 Tax=Evtepia sp. TaxID=2773933 RepID=UPI002A74EC54|nr:N-acetylmuramoyl-L-alanine amidase [Evtepia sp.]MDY3015113.1 N-acetylmuramoyl-L-alanine amidase [Evtepia sp.]
MPIIYLSPSTQEYNKYVNVGTEEEWMNRLADAMEPLLFASGIRYSRNTPDMTAASSIAASNQGTYDLHLALHSNAAGPGQEGTKRGIIAFYFPGSTQGFVAAQNLADGLKAIYPLPNQVRTEGTKALGEIRRVRAVAVLLELGFHDNAQDAQWIITHIDEMARSIVLSLTEYFVIPFFDAATPTPAQVQAESGALAVYPRPSTFSAPIAKLYDGAQVTILNRYEDWYLVQFGDVVGYAAAAFIAPI